MYLKSIEAHGFKAFANKTKLEFGPGITGVVGPNGSGKSNIADAVRWVLGEQSAKQLRGSSMQDVIFSGTENRKPLGFAYVTLTLDNSDHWLPISYEEVVVGRRVYRSGESEYLINGSVCRLRDVQELFFDTGIGKEGYSLIGQGQIDKIVSSKPDDRREIFDEAAGIVKYKRRKSAAEKNLETEKLNLSRVNDIISEIQKQIGPLEKQYEKAKIYLKLRDELKDLEVARFVAEYDVNNANLKALESKLDIVSNDLENARKEYESSKQEYELLLAELEKRRELLEKTKDEKNEALLAKQETENNIKLYEQQILAIKAGDEHYAKRLEATALRKSNYEKELEVYNTSLSNADKDIDKLRDRCKESETKLNAKKAEIEELLHEQSEINKRRLAMLGESAEVKGELERINTMGEQYKIRRAEINSRILSVKSELNLNASAIKDAEAELKRISGEVIAKAGECDALSEEQKALVSEIHELNDRRQRKKQELLVAESKLDTLKNLSERYEGYGSAVRRVMEEKKNISGVCGVVADLIKTDKKNETAIETALGGNIQNIVTKDQEAAKECIEFLKENRLGRATFIPLDIVKPKKDEITSDMLSEKGSIGIASSIVEYEEEYEPAVKYLLGRYLVVDNYDNALKIFKKYDRRNFVVTLTGELFAPGGAISGGAYKNNSNLLGRKRELDMLGEQLEACTKEVNALETELEEKREKRTKLEEKLSTMQSELSELFVEQNTAKINLNHAGDQNKELLKRKEDLARELEDLDDENSELAGKLKELDEKINASDEAAKEEEAHAEALTNKIAKAREEEEKLSAANVADITVVNTAEAGLGHIKENINRVAAEIDSVTAEEEELLKGRASSEQELSEKNAAIEACGEEIKRLEYVIKQKDEIIEELNGANEEMNRQNKAFFDQSQALNDRISSLDKEEFRLRSQKDRLLETIDGNTRYMWEEYELTISSAKELPIKAEHGEISKRQINELRGKIRALGDVNVGAIEDYKATSERYEFLKTQRDDILKAQKVLENIIDELDVDMRKQFLTTFEEVGKRFDATFKELFGGGSGKLELTEDEDVLEAGIKIIAQPPGKKLQNMMQLSGGEKALTAISLLFAILDLKPSPFCLLDEIEAALDDSNVSRFANYLKKLTANTQFIVITHRRGTMAAADSLYGITMQEKGVSALVSVNLVESELK